LWACGGGKDGGKPVADGGMELSERVGSGHGLRGGGFRVS
jgi:hypothetical protein